jgi:short-subunit dehydrogenase
MHGHPLVLTARIHSEIQHTARVLQASYGISVEGIGQDLEKPEGCEALADTDFFPKAQMEQTNAFQKNKVMAPQEVAKLGYEALMRGDRIFVPGGLNKALVFMRRLLPIPIQARKNKKFYQDAPANARKRRRGDIEREAAEKLGQVRQIRLLPKQSIRG